MSINLTAVIAGAALAVTVTASALVLISSSPMGAVVESSSLWPTSESPSMVRAAGRGSPDSNSAITASQIVTRPDLAAPWRTPCPLTEFLRVPVDAPSS